MSNFLRKVRIQIGLPGLVGREIRSGIRFKIEKSQNTLSNKAQVGLYNISRESKAFLETDNLIARIFTGYGTVDEQIFIGDLIGPIENKREGNNVITFFGVGDSEKSLYQANISVSLRSGQSFRTLISQAREKLGVSLGPIRGNLDKPLTSGYSFSGLVREMLTEVTQDLGLEWSIQDNELHIFPRGEHSKVQAVVLNQRTGLIGELSSTSTKLIGTSLLNPKIRPFRVLKVQSEIINRGIFKTIKVTHHADTQANAWTSKFEASPINV